MLSWKFNKFLRGFQTDNPMIPFLYVTFEGLSRWLLEKFILKETLAKTDSGRKLLKINPKDINIQKPADQVDIGFAAKLQIAEYKKKATYKESKVYTFCKEVTVLYATTASHFKENSPLKSPIVQYAICFDPSYIVKNQDKSTRGFGLLSERLLRLKRLRSSKYVEEAKEPAFARKKTVPVL